MSRSQAMGDTKLAESTDIQDLKYWKGKPAKESDMIRWPDDVIKGVVGQNHRLEILTGDLCPAVEFRQSIDTMRYRIV